MAVEDKEQDPESTDVIPYGAENQDSNDDDDEDGNADEKRDEGQDDENPG